MRLSPDFQRLEAVAARERLPRETLAVLGPDHHVPPAGVRLVWLEPITDISGGRSIREQALEPTHCRSPGLATPPGGRLPGGPRSPPVGWRSPWGPSPHPVRRTAPPRPGGLSAFRVAVRAPKGTATEPRGFEV